MEEIRWGQIPIPRTHKLTRTRLLKILLAVTLLGGLPLLLSGCALLADENTYAQPLTHEVDLWRQYVGVAIAIQYLLLTWALWKAHKRAKLSRLFLGLLFLPLVWTIIGEWVYRLGMWIVDWGWPGKIIAIVISFLGGAAAGGNIYPYVIGGVIFNDTSFLLYWTVPGVVASYAAAILYLVGKKE